VASRSDEEVVDFVQDFLGARIGAVNLIQHDHRRQLRRQRLLQNVTRLRQRSFASVDEHHNAVTMRSARSTSPPKSLWPGVSTILIFVS